MGNKYLRIGKVISVHGLKGDVKVFSTSDDYKRFDELKHFHLLNNDNANDDEVDKIDIYEKISVKYIKECPVIHIKGIDTIEEAQKLIGKSLYIDRIDAIKLSQNEYFIQDLMGLDVVAEDKFIGKVVDILKTKANDIIVVQNSEIKKELLIPMVDEFISDIDVEKGIVNIKNFAELQ